MKFECFYYPILVDDEVVKSNEDLISFEFGDAVPCKTLYYNYGQNFAIYKNEEFFIVENGILKQTIISKDLKYPLRLVFNKGTQLTIFSQNDLSSIRLLLKGENEKEKQLGELFYLSMTLNRKIKNIQYKVISDLTNSSRDSTYINKEIDLRTKRLLDKLRFVESKFNHLVINYPEIKNSYLNYMNFSNKEDMLELSINKYFKENTEEYKEYILKSSVWKSKPIYPKFKLDNLVNSCNYNI
ncbi:hypothetical protein [Faecalimicrobium dakarense]|uniref:hypothetical protein n=1 Tax=Faecalimicrobium dakarense TaxID=1301100 RepID=UPI0004B696AF|nr:hypothetical protein [[Clostridium] dakarense]